MQLRALLAISVVKRRWNVSFKSERAAAMARKQWRYGQPPFSMRIFEEQRLSEHLENVRQQLKLEIEREPQNKLLNVNESDYVTYLKEKFSIEPLSFDFEAVQVSDGERMVSTEQHPFDSAVHLSRMGKRAFARQVIIFHLPYKGDASLLRCQPASYFTGGTPTITDRSSEICFEIINWRDDQEELIREKDNALNKIKKLAENVKTDVDQYNAYLETQIRSLVAARKAHFMKKMGLVASLGIPLRKSPNAPATFAVPVAPKKIAVKPASPDSIFRPDPTLDVGTYQDVLNIIHGLGMAMERHPSTYIDKQEEDLRDLFLTTLCTHYSNTTGETFNKSGKTDILIRHGDKNVFVGECKFWHGIKGFSETIDQILGYLTWRDSKAAIVCFVQNKDFGAVLQQVTEGTMAHKSFVREKTKKNESWMEFELRLPSDPSRNVHLAVQCFHFVAA